MMIDYKGFGFVDKDHFLRWRTSFYPDEVYKLKRIVDDEQDNDSFDLIDCLYTDGDDGVLKFTSFSEVFDSYGVSVELIDCQYCDLSFKFMEKISRKMKKFNQGK